jgi:hypothetical protein
VSGSVGTVNDITTEVAFQEGMELITGSGARRWIGIPVGVLEIEVTDK